MPAAAAGTFALLHGTGGGDTNLFAFVGATLLVSQLVVFRNPQESYA